MSGPFQGGQAEPEPLEQSLAGTPTSARLGIWELAWPSMTMYALHSLVGVVDFVFVSSLGTEAVAAVGVALQVHFFVFGVLAAVTTGTVAVVARETGAGSYEEAARASVVLAAAIGGALMTAIPFAESLVSLLGLAPSVASLGGDCLGVLLAVNVPFAAGFALSMALRGAGDVKTPLVVGIGTNLLNVVGDYALVFGKLGAPALGALGSAVATAASMTIGSVVLLVLWRRDTLVLPYGAWRPALSAERSWRLLRIGLPSAAEQAVCLCLLADYVVKASLLSARFASGAWQRVAV